MKNTANIIKFAAITTAMPRWIAALLAAEGLVMPEAWAPGWVVFSALSAAGMAIVEGLAFSYVFSAWRNQHDKQARNLLTLTIISAVIFIAVLTPYIAASVEAVKLADILDNRLTLLAWSAAVAASTIAIVVSVGYAEKLPVTKPDIVTKTVTERVTNDVTESDKDDKLMDKAQFVLEMQRRNGAGPMTIEEIVRRSGRGVRTAQRWIKDYEEMHK